MRELALLFGATAQAAVATPAALVLGLAVRRARRGQRSRRIARPLQGHALREAGVLVVSLDYFLLAKASATTDGALCDKRVSTEPGLLVLVKLLLVLVFLSPTSPPWLLGSRDGDGPSCQCHRCPDGIGAAVRVSAACSGDTTRLGSTYGQLGLPKRPALEALRAERDEAMQRRTEGLPDG